MRIVALLAGLAAIALILVDAFETLVLARRTRHVFRLARAYYRISWRPVAAIGKRIRSPLHREAFLAIFGPMSLLQLFALWTAGLIFAFGLLQWSARMQPAELRPTFANDLYISSTTLFTLATGDPRNPTSKVISTTEGGLGLALLALAISYLPVLYDSFSKRELTISLLDARAGSPPSAGELLHTAPSTADKLERQLAGWEKWEAGVLENQLSFPMMAYFRSQHANQAWLTALVAMVDFAAVVVVAADGDLRQQAELTFAMGRHVLSDVTVIFGLEKAAEAEKDNVRLTDDQVGVLRRRVAAKGAGLNGDRLTLQRLTALRCQYEPQAFALSDYLLMSLPHWLGDEASRNNWQVPLLQRGEAPFAVSDPFVRDIEEDRRA